MRAWYLIRTERLASTVYEGATFFYPSRSIIGRAIADGKGWDVTLPSIVDELMSEDPVVIEVGSNIGASLVQIKRARPRAVVYCCEPSSRFAPILRRNIQSYGWHDVTVVEAVFGSATERRSLYSNTSTASLVAANYGSHQFLAAATIETTTLDTAFAALERVELVKIDTDGFDYDVMLGGEDLLRKFHPVLHFEFAPMLLEAANRSPDDVVSFVQGLGYGTLVLLELDGHPLAMSSDRDEIVALARDHNYVDVVAVHDSLREGSHSLNRLMQLAPAL
jgi:FkbM family methyltransferase